MSIVKGPLFSLDADGTIGKSLSYSKKSQNNIVSKYSKPGDVSPGESSPRQKDQRSIIRLITIHWQCMDDIDRLTWETAAKAARFKGSGYHYFLHIAQTDLLTYLGLAGYWSMNYETSGVIPDLSGNGNHAFLSPIYPCDCPSLVDSFDKKYGKSLYNNGSGRYSYIKRNPIFELQTLTISFCFKAPPNIPTYSTLGINKYYSSSWASFDCNSGSSVNANAKTYIYTSAGAKTIYLLNILDNKWHNLTFSFNGSFFTAYIDGSLYDSIPYAGNVLYNANNLYIGSYKLGSYSHGFIDEALIYNTALDPKEILKIYQSYNLS